MSRNAQVTFQTILVIFILLLCCCMIVLAGAIIWWTYAFPGMPTSIPLAHYTPTAADTATSTASPDLTRQTITPSPTQEVTTPSVKTPRPKTPSSTPTLRPKTSTPMPTETPAIKPTGQLTTEQQVLAVILPQRDIRLLAERLKKAGPVPEIVHATPPAYELNQDAEFWVGNVDSLDHTIIKARLEYITPHLYVWVEKGLRFDRDNLIQSADNFEEKIYPTNREFFGSEWSPGVDSDVHLHILHSSGLRLGDSVAGIYSSADEYSRLANPYSNEREMFYVSLDGAEPGSDFYDGVLAHEFQHMIHWVNDRNEDTWVNEGCAELAAYLNGYDPGGFDWLFLADPDVQLNAWVDDSVANYGSSYLFMAYFLGRFGEEAMQRVIANPANGPAGFSDVLAEQGLVFDDVFADWLVANYLDNMNVVEEESRYMYPDHTVGPVSTVAIYDDYPVSDSGTVHQYAADYIELAGQGDLAITFSGDTQAQLAPTDAHSGQYAWWSNRGDDSDATLTRAFDLRTVKKATLRFWTWYDIEENWDYAYVEVSTDGGQTWDLLSGPSSTTDNPSGNSFGPAYTGASGGWIQETFDLNRYVGKEILLRFEYVTDDAVNQTGWLIDDISIPELNYLDDGESGQGDWESGGFIYSDNRVSQRYLVQLVAFGRETEVLRMELDETQQGRLELRGLGDQVDSAMLVISAIAPVTTEMASYSYAIEPLE